MEKQLHTLIFIFFLGISLPLSWGSDLIKIESGLATQKLSELGVDLSDVCKVEVTSGFTLIFDQNFSGGGDEFKIEGGMEIESGVTVNWNGKVTFNPGISITIDGIFNQTDSGQPFSNGATITGSGGMSIAGSVTNTGNFFGGQTCSGSPCLLGSLLPINLLSFSATTQINSVTLNWQTGTEQNNDYMAVERSRDGKHFDEIGRIAGRGTTDELQSYSFFDEKPFPGLNYYRLRQVDFDGTMSYHRVIAIFFNKKTDEVLVFPTLASEQVFIYLDQPLENKGTVQVIDLSGKVRIRRAIDPNIQSTSIEIGQLASGHYFLQIQYGEEKLVERFVRK